jgi:hypothetical protein
MKSLKKQKISQHFFICRNVLLIFFIFLNLNTARAQVSGSSANEFSVSLFDSFNFIKSDRFEAKPCVSKNSQDMDHDLSVKELFEMKLTADDFKSQRFYCEAVEIYSQIINAPVSSASSSTSSQGSLRDQAYYSLLESYFFQYDEEHFFSEGLLFLQDSKISLKIKAQGHFLLLKALQEKISQEPLEKQNTQNQWVQYVLGTHPEQQEENSEKIAFSYRNFLEGEAKNLPPNDPKFLEVKVWMREAQALYNKQIVEEARIKILKGDLAPAILQFELILKQGVEAPEFAEAMYEMVTLLVDFSYSVRDSSRISNLKLARWMVLTPTQINAQKREEISLQLLQQARDIFKMMQEKLPQSYWTQKLDEEIIELQ